jgi:hypothetical protein
VISVAKEKKEKFIKRISLLKRILKNHQQIQNYLRLAEMSKV